MTLIERITKLQQYENITYSSGIFYSFIAYGMYESTASILSHHP